MGRTPHVVLKYFPELEAKKQLLMRMEEEYLSWNDRINVISRKDTENFFTHHVLHSLALVPFLKKMPEKSRIIDVGTGGGFPGIPLAVFFPEFHFTLVDSIAKKMKVVEAVAESLHLENVQCVCGRMEKVKGQFDAVVTRAVAPMKKIAMWTQNLTNDNPLGGIIALKGGDLQGEMEEYGKPYQEKELSMTFEEDFFETKKVIFAPYF